MNGKSFLFSRAICIVLLITAGCKKDTPTEKGGETQSSGEEKTQPGGEDKEQERDLMMIGNAYWAAWSNDVIPKKPKDLLKYFPEGKTLNFDRYVIVWGVDVKDIKKGESIPVIAYPKDAAEKGGLVQLLNLDQRKVGAAEFKTLTIAKPSIAIHDRPAVATLSAKELLDKFAKNATKQFDQKVIEISGVIVGFDNLSKYEGSTDEIKLGVPGNNEVIRCMVDELQPWARLGAGQQLTVKGRLTGEYSPILKNCTIVAKGPETTISTTAEKLTAELDADKNAFEKYARKPCIITGEVLRIDDKMDQLRIVLYLKGNSKNPVKCALLGGTNVDWAEKLTPGQKIKLYGVFDYGLDKFPVYINECQFVDNPP